MSVLRDSHRGIVPAFVVYVYTSNAICSNFHEFLSTVWGLLECTVHVTLNPNRSSNKSTHLCWRTENNARKHLFSVLMDG